MSAIKIILSIFIVNVSILCVAKGGVKLDDKDGNSKLYTIQIASWRYKKKNLKEISKIIKKLPKEYEKSVYFYKIHGYLCIRSFKSDTILPLKKELSRIRKCGFENALIVKTTKLRTKINTINLFKKKEDKDLPVIKIVKHSINGYEVNDLILKADKAYQEGDIYKALRYLESVLRGGFGDYKIKNNLCYLYGKTGNWKKAKKIIKKTDNLYSLLYAYAYGALEANSPTFFSDLSEYIKKDPDGHLPLIAGLYLERRGEKALSYLYYKKSYIKNPSDFYNVFSYARSLDLQKKYKKAIDIYKMALRLSKGKNSRVIEDRISQLRSIL